MDGQRLLKMVSSKDNSEVTFLVPQDIQDPSFTVPGSSQDDAHQLMVIPSSLQRTGVHQQALNLFLPNQPSTSQYQTSKPKPSQYPPHQQSVDFPHYQPSLDSQYQTNQNRPVLSTTMAGLSSSSGLVTPPTSLWTSKDYAMWTPKKVSGKWLQQDSGLFQEKNPEFSTLEEPALNGQTVTDSFFKSSLKNQEHVLYTDELIQSSITKENCFNNQDVISVSHSQTASFGMFKGELTQNPVNLGSMLPTNSNLNSGNMSFPVRPSHFTVNTCSSLDNSMASPVYKSKLEKAVEQKHTTSTAGPSGSVGKYESGTLKRLLSSDVGDLGAYKVFRHIGLMPHVETFLEQSESTPKDEEQFLIQTSTLSKVDQSNCKGLLKKKDMMLSKKTSQTYRLNEPCKVEPSSGNSCVYGQSLDSWPLMSEVNVTTVGTQSAIPNNVGATLNAVKEHLQVINKSSLDNQVLEDCDRSNMDMYKYTRKGPYGIRSDQSAGICTTGDLIGEYAAPLLMDMVTEVITQKQYVNSSWGDMLMQEQWRLRDNGQFCDAVFHCNERQFKFHRIVMSAVSRDFLNRDHSHDGETHLVLPQDISYENVCLFMEYVYLGRIQLNINNVQQIYRLSSLFDISDLNKYCYDFCRLAKLGHLIISSPYQETARQVHKSEEHKVPTDKPHVNTSNHEAPLQIADVGSIDQIADILKKKSHIENITPHSKGIDFDWLTSDPDQSNIPIRKRGRTRQNLKVSMESTNKRTETCISPHKVDSRPIEGQCDINYRTPVQSIYNQDLSLVKNNENVEPESGSMQENQTAQTFLSESCKETKESCNEIALDELPDPLATGKFDDTKLIKKDKIIKKTQKSSISVTSTRKPMVTRFRGQPKTMTVLEAASNKKAKYDNPIGITQKLSKEKTFGKKTFKGLKSKEKQNCEATKTQENRSSSKPLVVDESNDDLAPTVGKDNNSLESETSEQTQTVSPRNGHISPKTSEAVPAKKRQNIVGDAVTIDKEAGNDSAEKDYPHEADENSCSLSHHGLPKIPRLRKSTIDQQLESPVKNQVYMRPPKKRTKEISEMMKIEADGPENVKKDSTPEKAVPASETKSKRINVKFNSLLNTNLLSLAESKQKKQTKSKLLKDGAIHQAVYEVEQYGRSIEGEKHYRCCLCNSVFVFSKRAITHIVNTHDISLEETVEYIDVEHKKPQSKKCDICGYVTKEINIYYIHFHKYFKHGVPLPKGWQPFRCDLCKKEFFTKFQLREHKLIHFEDNPFVCELCGNGFKSRTGLNSHMFHKHSSVRNHKCPDCIKSFKTKTQMKVHQRTHTGEKPFACKDSQCNYRSTTRGNMKLHLLNRHKYTTHLVDEFMRDLKCSFNEPSGADIDEATDLWEIEVENEDDDVHGGIQVKMEGFDVNHAAFETLVGAAAELANSDRNFAASSISNEQENMSSGTLSCQVPSIADQIMVQIVDNQLVSCNRQASLVCHPNRETKTSRIQTQNLPRHVELLMQNANTLFQTNDTAPQNGHAQIICEYETESDQVDLSQSSNNQNLAHQAVRALGHIADSSHDDIDLDALTGQQQRGDIISRDSRSSGKQLFQSQDKKSLFKATMQSVKNECLLRHDNGNLLQVQQSFDGPVNVPASSLLREQLLTEEQIIQDLRQAQGNTNFNIDDHGIYMALSTQHQHQTSSQEQLSSLQQTPPAYHLSTQSKLSTTQPSLLISHLHMRQENDLNRGQEVSQGHDLAQGQDLVQRQDDQANSSSIQSFGGIAVSQAAVGSFNNSEENQLYPGFYQENYQIENY